MSTVCGTAGYTGPSPGDPDNSSVLSAAAAFGGIDITWSYPGVNPHAVAHFKLYRSTSGTEGTQVLLTTVNGNFFYDKTIGTTNTEYFYWISIVSANDGHESEMIGPVSAIARPTIEDVMQGLTDKINQGHLAQSLKQEIQAIEGLGADLASEQAARLAEYDGLTEALNQMNNSLEDTSTLIQEETLERKTADSAQASQINLWAANTNENTAMVTEERIARTTADEALAERLDILQAANVQTFYQDTAPDPLVVELEDNALWVDTSEPEEGEDPEFPVSQWIDEEWMPVVGNTLAGAFAAIESQSMARVAGDDAIARDVETIETSLGRKSRTFFQANPPVAENTGDLWINTSNKNKLSMWDGTKWADARDTDIAEGAGRNQVFRQSEVPQPKNVGDLWFKSDEDDKGYRWSGGQWESLNLYTGNQVTATVKSNNASMIGYCEIGGSPDSSHETPEACNIAGGTWLAATPLAEAVKTVQIRGSDGELGSVQQLMEAHEDNLGDLNAAYTAQVDVNGTIGGFGIYNDGEEVQAGFNVHTFWVGESSTDKVYPFMIEGDEVFINQAVIKELTFNKLRSTDGSVVVNSDGKLLAEHIDAQNLSVQSAVRFNGNVESDSFVAGSAGWQILQSGFVEFNEAVIRGNVELESITVNDELPVAGTILEGDTFNSNRAMTSSSYENTVTRTESVSFNNVPEGSRFTYSFAAGLSCEVQGRSGNESINEIYHQVNADSLTDYVYPSDLPNDESWYYDIEYGENWAGRLWIKGHYYSLESWFYSDSISSTRYRANISLTFKVWVNGSLEVNESSSNNIDFTLQTTWSGNNNTRGSISRVTNNEDVSLSLPLSTNNNYIFPSYQSSAEVKIEAQVSVSNVRCTGNQPGSGGRRLLRAITQAGLSGELSRLG